MPKAWQKKPPENLISPHAAAAAPTVDIEAVVVHQQESQLLTNFIALQQDLQWQNVILTFRFTSAFEVSVLHQQKQQYSSETSQTDYTSVFVSLAILFTVVLLPVIKLIDGKLTVICQALEKVAILIATVPSAILL